MRALRISLIAVAVLFIFAFLAWSRVPDILSNALTKKMGVTVTIDDIDLGWHTVTLEKLEVGNAPGYSLPHALTAQEIIVDAPLQNHFKEYVILDEITINDIYLGLEFDSASSTKGNWTTIMNNLATDKQETNNHHKILIKRLVLNRINTDVFFKKEGGKVRHLPIIQQIVFTNITSEGGVPSEQIANSVLTQMLVSVFTKQNMKNMLQDFAKNPPKGLNDLIKPFIP